MSDKTIELNRRHVLGGMITIGGAAAAAGAGTVAYFTDSEESTGNTITAASLDLSIDGGNETATTTVEAGTSGTGVVPGQNGSGNSPITNTGTIDGYVDVEITDVSSNSLASNLNVDVSIDDDNDTNTSDDQTTVVSDTAANIAGDYEVDHLLPSGNSSNLVVEWDLPSSVTDGEGESVTFDVTVFLDQTQGQ